MSDPIEHFRLAIAAAGLEAPDNINPDGTINRFSTSGRRGDDSGWYMLQDGTPAGAFGCWRSGLQLNWCAKSDNTMTDPERKAHRQRTEAMKAQREANTLKVQQQASNTAAALWANADTATVHNYLTAKGIKPHGVKFIADKLLIPLRDAADILHSLQTIASEGDKRFHPGGRVKGCYHSMANRIACWSFVKAALLGKIINGTMATPSQFWITPTPSTRSGWLGLMLLRSGKHSATSPSRAWPSRSEVNLWRSSGLRLTNMGARSARF